MTRSQRLLAFFVVAICLGLVAAAPKDPPRGPFSRLSVGQIVTLKEVGGGHQITIVPGLPTGHKLTEVGTDYVAVEDPSGTTETRIPITSVRSIVVMKGSGKEK